MSETKVLSKPRTKTTRKSKAASRQAFVASIKGKYAAPYSPEDFNRDKRRETALEDQA